MMLKGNDLFNRRVQGALGDSSTLSTFVDPSGTPGPDSSGLGPLANLVQSGIMVYDQQQILQANIDRAKLGLPPIDASSISPTFNVGLSPDTKTLLIFGAIALFLFMSKKK